MESRNTEIKDKIRAFWDNPHQNYDRVHAHGVYSELENEIWRNALTQLLGEKKLKILDIGTGTGFLALLLAEMGHNVTGADWSNSKLEEAKKKIKGEITIKFVKEDAEDLSFEGDIFDAVVSRHVIWTLTNPKAVINELIRVTKPKGQIIVDVPEKNSHVGNHHFGEEIGKELPFYNGADPEEVVKMFEEAGLGNISVRNFEKMTLVKGEKL
ncbi:MAG: methyltransferase domain-containing protein [Methanosarcinales archaeon]|nr:methyltransferase domain-containing protein [Methanosarcinales archaeon]